jgi:hypothetical protein
MSPVTFRILLAAVPLVGCLPVKQAGYQASELDSMEQSTPLDVSDIATALTDIFSDIDPLVIKAQLQTTAVSDYWSSLDTLDSPGTLSFKTRAVTLQSGDVRTAQAQKKEARKSHSQKARTVLEMAQAVRAPVEVSEFSDAFLRISALVSADESIGTFEGLSLTGQPSKLSDIRTLAKLGKDIYNNPGRAIPAGLNRETWELIKRNRTTIGIGLNLAMKLKPNHPKVKKYAKVIRGVMLASDFMTKQFQGREYLTDEVSALD